MANRLAAVSRRVGWMRYFCRDGTRFKSVVGNNETDMISGNCGFLGPRPHFELRIGTISENHKKEITEREQNSRVRRNFNSSTYYCP